MKPFKVILPSCPVFNKFAASSSISIKSILFSIGFGQQHNQWSCRNWSFRFLHQCLYPLARCLSCASAAMYLAVLLGNEVSSVFRGLKIVWKLEKNVQKYRMLIESLLDLFFLSKVQEASLQITVLCSSRLFWTRIPKVHSTSSIYNTKSF